MNQRSEHLRYRAYILRLWQERPAARGCPAAWRLSIEDVHGNQRCGFGNIEGLTAFLQSQMEEADDLCKLSEEENHA